MIEVNTAGFLFTVFCLCLWGAYKCVTEFGTDKPTLYIYWACFSMFGCISSSISLIIYILINCVRVI